MTFGWRLHAYVIMRHHHLAAPPQSNLGTGMHRLQTPFATGLNRLREERGHLFQGRKQAVLVEDGAAPARVAS